MKSHIQPSPPTHEVTHSSIISTQPSSHTLSHISTQPSSHTLSHNISTQPSSHTLGHNISTHPSSHTAIISSPTHQVTHSAISTQPSSHTLRHNISTHPSSHTLSHNISTHPSSHTLSHHISTQPSSLHPLGKEYHTMQWWKWNLPLLTLPSVIDEGLRSAVWPTVVIQWFRVCVTATDVVRTSILVVILVALIPAISVSGLNMQPVIFLTCYGFGSSVSSTWCSPGANSKHWFTTAILQSVP